MSLFSKQIDKRIAAYQRELIETHYREVDNMYRQIRGWRHDYRNHIQTMKVLAANGDMNAIKAYLVINNSWEEVTTVELPKEAAVYALTGNGKLRSRTMLLNGKELVLGENDQLPVLEAQTVPAGTLEIVPGGCTFIVL